MPFPTTPSLHMHFSLDTWIYPERLLKVAEKRSWFFFFFKISHDLFSSWGKKQHSIKKETNNHKIEVVTINSLI